MLPTNSNLLALVLFFAASPLAVLASTKITALTVEDHSSSGSPVQISGQVRLRETFVGNEMTTSILEDRLVAKNISDRTILMMIVWVELYPSHAGADRSVRQYECFFAPDVIKPGDDHSLAGDTGRQDRQPFNPGQRAREPRLEAKVAYIQFLDGSEFGDPAQADQMFLLRKVTRRNLNRLNRAFDTSGEAAFREALSEKVQPGEVDVFFENIRITARTRGTKFAVAQVKVAIKFAEERTAGFHQPPRE